MRKPRKKPPTLIIDSREKKPWDFDEDADFDGIVIEKLNVGDYSIRGLEGIICIERKSSADELYMNCFSQEHRERLRREMQRFQEVEHRFVIIEEDLADVLDPRNYYVNKAGRNKFSPKMPPAVVMRELIDFMLNYSMHVIFAGGKAQSLAKRLLLQAYNDYEQDDQESTSE